VADSPTEVNFLVSIPLALTIIQVKQLKPYHDNLFSNHIFQNSLNLLLFIALSLKEIILYKNIKKNIYLYIIKVLHVKFYKIKGLLENNYKIIIIIYIEINLIYFFKRT